MLTGYTFNYINKSGVFIFKNYNCFAVFALLNKSVLDLSIKAQHLILSKQFKKRKKQYSWLESSKRKSRITTEKNKTEKTFDKENHCFSAKRGTDETNNRTEYRGRSKGNKRTKRRIYLAYILDHTFGRAAHRATAVKNGRPGGNGSPPAREVISLGTFC